MTSAVLLGQDCPDEVFSATTVTRQVMSPPPDMCWATSEIGANEPTLSWKCSSLRNGSHVTPYELATYLPVL